MGLNTELRGKQLANLRSDAIVKPWFLLRGKQRKGKRWMNWLVIIFSCSFAGGDERPFKIHVP
jgi:hypothetical protein